MRTKTCHNGVIMQYTDVVYQRKRRGDEMTHKIKFIQTGHTLLFITLISVLFSCAPSDPAEIAANLAREWTANNIDSVSKGIAAQVVSNNPLLEATISAAISNEIKQRITWEYAKPQKLNEVMYGVITTASIPIEVPLLGNYKISVNYNLKINTSEKSVISADMDAGSFAMTKQ